MIISILPFIIQIILQNICLHCVITKDGKSCTYCCYVRVGGIHAHSYDEVVVYFLCYVSKISAISKKASLRKIWSLKSYGYFYKLTNAGQTFQPIFLIYDWVN